MPRTRIKSSSIDTTTGAGLPVGTTAQRPASPTNGLMRINSTTNYMEVYYNGTWTNLNYIGGIVATGGTVSTSGGFRYHTFTSSGTFSVTQAGPLSAVDVLVVAGGGGGGTDTDVGGGGGGGGLVTSNVFVSSLSYPIVIGAGGNRGTGPDNTGTGGGSNGTNGANSTAFGITAVGGGYGGTRNTSGGSGGSGGGGGDGATSGGAGTAGQGYNGGNGGGAGFNQNSGNDSGGGGGAGGAAVVWTPGPGFESSISGANVTYAAGGRGAQLITPADGTANTGNGGTGARNGGSGIVIIRYAI